MLGIQYGSEASLQLTRRIMKLISETTWQASIELARERGVFLDFTADDICKVILCKVYRKKFVME